MKNFTYTKLLIYITIGAVIFWILAVLAYKFFNVGFTLEATVITFIGILATFVVVSNYLQVKEIKEDLSQKITEANESLKSTNELVHKAKSDIGKMYLDSANLTGMGYVASPEQIVGYLSLAIIPIFESGNRNIIDSLVNSIRTHIEAGAFEGAVENIEQFKNNLDIVSSLDPRIPDIMNVVNDITPHRMTLVLNGGNASDQ